MIACTKSSVFLHVKNWSLVPSRLCFSMSKIDHLQQVSCDDGSLFCFVLSTWDLPILWRFILASWYLPKALSCRPLDINGKLSRRVWVHPLGLRLFGATLWKLLIIEPFSQWKLNKITTDNCIGIWGSSWCFWKAHHQSDLIDFISQFSELRCERYWIFLVNFVAENSKNCKNWVWKEKSVEPPMCSHCQIWKFLILKMWRIKNVFTLLPMAHATLVSFFLRKVVCLFCLSCWDHPNHGALYCAIGINTNSSISRVASRWFCNVSTFNARVTYWILSNFVKKISTNFKWIFVGKFGQVFGIVGKPLMGGISWYVTLSF